MNKFFKRFLSTISFIVILSLILSACSSSGGKINKDGISVPNDVELTAEQFKDFFDNEKFADFSVDDYTSQFVEELEYPITSYLIANSEEAEITIEFMIFEDEKTAKECYVNYACDMDAEITPDTITAEETNEDHAKYVFSEEKYRSITRIGKSVLMVASIADNGEQIQQILLELGY